MSSGGWMMLLASALSIAALAFLLYSLVGSIRKEKSGRRRLWQEFGLGLSLLVLFLGTWAGQGITQWQTYTDEQQAHGEAVEAGDFFAEFGQSTLENWQSEFLQLFAFVVLAALLIHKGSAESKDGDDKLEASLRRIEEALGTLPAKGGTAESWQLPDTPLDDRPMTPARVATV